MNVTKSLPALLNGISVVPDHIEFPKWPFFDSSDENAIIHHLRNHNLSAYEVIDGPLFEFENELKLYFNVEYALLVSSGTAGLYSAFSALELNPGEEVIVPAIGFPGSGLIPLHLGVNIRFVDVDPFTGNPTVDQIDKVINKRTRALLITHAWGIPPDMLSLKILAKKRNLHIIEDAARACGSSILETPVGGMGDIGIISFHELKAVPAGEGGVLLTSNRNYYEHAVALGHYFRSKDKMHLSTSKYSRYHESGLGLNYKIHPLAAALARSQFKKLELSMSSMTKYYDQILEGTKSLSNFKFLSIPHWTSKISFYGFNFLYNIDGNPDLPNTQTIIHALNAEGIKASKPGTPPLYKLPAFIDILGYNLIGRVVGGINPKDFPGAELHDKTLIRLPSIRQNENGTKWAQYYIEALTKIHDNLSVLRNWEKNN